MVTRKLEDEGTCSVDTVGRGRSSFRVRGHKMVRDVIRPLGMVHNKKLVLCLDGRQPQLPHPAWTGPGNSTEVMEERSMNKHTDICTEKLGSGGLCDLRWRHAINNSNNSETQ